MVDDIVRELRQTQPVAFPITNADEQILEVTAHLLQAFRDDPLGFPTARLAQLRGFLAALGRTPAERRKLKADEIQPVAESGIWAGLLDDGVGATKK